MHDAIELFRGLNGAVWLVVLIYCASSVFRVFANRSKTFDPSWSLAWWFAFVQVGYTLRWLASWKYSPASDVDVSSLLGLLVITTGIGASILVRRVRLGGWRP